jgi:hypothetical protein
MTRNRSNPSLLAQIFAAEGNPLHATASGFRTGHEPVHASTSGTCVNLPMDQNHWHCFNCQQGGGPVEAIMSLKGVSRNEAEAHLRALSGEPGAGEEDARGKLSQATMLVRLAESAVELFHDPVLKTYARVLNGDHREVWPTRSTSVRRWLIRQYYQANDAVPNADAVNMAAHTLEAIAQFDGPCRLVHVRVAPDGGGGVFIDLGDASWRAIHITPGAWQVVEQRDVRRCSRMRCAGVTCARILPIMSSSRGSAIAK